MVELQFFISDNPGSKNGPKSLPRNPPDCIILDNWVFNNLISVDDLLARVLPRLATCLLVNDNLWGKLISLSLMIFDDNLKTTFD